MELEFLNYTKTPNEKHLGIATVKIYNRIILRWKIIPNKDGSSFFPGCASYKMPDPSGGNSDIYQEAFMLDSRSEHDEVKNFILSHVKKYMQNDTATIKKEASVHEELIPF